MKILIAMLLASSVGVSYAANDNNQRDYDKAKAEAEKDYKEDIARCKDMRGGDKSVCTEEARASRARAEADAVAEYKDDKTLRTRAREAAAEAEYALARARCALKSGAEKNDCTSDARKEHERSLADARADRPSSTAIGSSRAGATATGSADAQDRKAMQNCEEMTGDARSACLVDRRNNPTASEARSDMARAGDRAADSAAGMAQRAENTTERMADRAGENMADAATTTRVKAKLMAEENLKSLGIHVETENGVVMLSGFVNSKSEAKRAVDVAKSVKGVNKVESAIKVK